MNGHLRWCRGQVVVNRSLQASREAALIRQLNELRADVTNALALAVACQNDPKHLEAADVQ